MPKSLINGMSVRVPREPQRCAKWAPAPLAWSAKTATELAMLMLARKAVSDSVVVESLRLATSAARWKLKRTVVDA